MPILKTVEYENGAMPQYHLPQSLRYDFGLQVAVLHVVSYVDEAAYLAGKPLCANWNIPIPAGAIASDIGASVLAYLIGAGDSPFAGGTIITAGGGDLQEARSRKIQQMNDYCAAQIYAGYTSSALGAPHLYPSGEKDQSNLVGSVTSSLYPDLPAGWSTPFWCADEEGVWSFAPHSASQIQQVGVDAKAAILAAMIKNETLRGAIEAATTQAELDLISW